MPCSTSCRDSCWREGAAPSPAPAFLHRPAWVRARPGHRLLACSAVAGVSPGGERILAWAAAAWPPSRHGQRLTLQGGLGFPSGRLAWNVCGNLRPWKEVHHVGACPVVGALTFSLDVAAVAAHRVWSATRPWPQPLPHADERTGSSYSAEAVVLERDGNKHGESKCGAFNVPTCPDAWMRRVRERGSDRWRTAHPAALSAARAPSDDLPLVLQVLRVRGGGRAALGTVCVAEGPCEPLEEVAGRAHCPQLI